MDPQLRTELQRAKDTYGNVLRSLNKKAQAIVAADPARLKDAQAFQSEFLAGLDFDRIVTPKQPK